MKCLILAAGYATRLYPLCENFPKPLLTVKGKTILDWLIDDLDASGEIDGYIVISNHKFYHHFKAWAEKRPQSITVLDDGTVSNESRLGAVRDMQFAIDTLSLDDDLLIVAGDNLLDFSLLTLVRYAKEKNASAIMRYYEASEEKLLKCGVVTLGEGDRVIDMTEKSKTPATHWCVPPFYFYKKEDARRIGEGIAAGCGVDAPGSFAAWISKNSKVFAMEMPGKRYDIGNLASYEAVQHDFCGIK